MLQLLSEHLSFDLLVEELLARMRDMPSEAREGVETGRVCIRVASDDTCQVGSTRSGSADKASAEAASAVFSPMSLAGASARRSTDTAAAAVASNTHPDRRTLNARLRAMRTFAPGGSMSHTDVKRPQRLYSVSNSQTYRRARCAQPSHRGGSLHPSPRSLVAPRRVGAIGTRWTKSRRQRDGELPAALAKNVLCDTVEDGVVERCWLEVEM